MMKEKNIAANTNLVICDELSTYRSITSVDVRDGSSTSF
jgi:hypothetical protein